MIQLNKYGLLTGVTTFPVGYSYKVQDGFRRGLFNIGLADDTVNAINSVLGAQLFIFRGQSIGVDDGPLLAAQCANVAKIQAPDYVCQGAQQIQFDCIGPLNIAIVFRKARGYVLNGTAQIEFTLNVSG